MTAFYKEYAPTLQGLGYPIVPIMRGSKRPAGGPGWRKAMFRAKDPRFQGDDWGVGIQCGIKLPNHEIIVGVDIDFLYEPFVKAVTKWVFENVAVAPIRVGMAPKRMLIFRMLEPGITKIFSDGYTQSGVVDSNGKAIVQKVEILGDGQQFVAYGRHPDSGKDYAYPAFEFNGQRFERCGIAGILADELPVVAKDQLYSICDAITEIAKKFPTLHPVSNAPKKPKMGKSEKEADEDGVVPFTVRCEDITLENAINYFVFVDPDSVTYSDDWRMIGAALHHQFKGSEDALMLWDSWSSGMPMYDDEHMGLSGLEYLRYRWNHFKEEGNGKAPVTFKSVIARYLEWKKAARVEARTKREAEDRELISLINDCANQQRYTELLEDVIPLIRKQLVPEDTDRVLLFKGALRKAISKAAGCTIKWSNKELHQRLFPRPKTPEEALSVELKDRDWWAKKSPPWARDWVYISSEEVFVNPNIQNAMKAAGFNSLMAKHIRREEGETVTPLASRIVLSGGLIPVAHRRVYWPGKPWMFMNGVKGVEICYNSFNPSLITDPLPSLDDCSMEEDEAIDVLKRHICMLINGAPNIYDRNCQIFVSWLRHQYEFPGKKVRWTPLLVSKERAGKSYFSSCLLQTLLGSENIKPLSASIIMKSAETSFNDWSFGACVAAIEELHITGSKKHEVVNFMKDKQTNDEINCHPKGGAVYKAMNTQNYIAYSNYDDAIPVGEASARWFILYCKGTEKAARALDPLYYDRLFESTKAYPAAIGRWLLEQPYHREFNPESSAPWTKGRQEMASLTSAVDSAPDNTIEELIDSSTIPEIGPNIVHAGQLEELANARKASHKLSMKHIVMALHGLGYEYVERRVTLPDGRRFRPWVKRDVVDTSNATVLDAWVRKEIESRALAVDSI